METKTDKKLTIREKIAFNILCFMLEIVNPFGYDHQIKEKIKELKDSLKD